MSCRTRTYRDVTYGPTPMSWDFLSIGGGPKGVRQTCKEERGHPHCYVVLHLTEAPEIALLTNDP